MAGTLGLLFLFKFAVLIWTVRIMVNLFYLKHADGPCFVGGHALLVFLFLFFILLYGGIVVRQ